MIGLSGNSVINRREVLEKAFKSLSLKERNLIQDSDQSSFKVFYQKASTENHLPTVIPEGSEELESVRSIVQRVEKEGLYKGKGGEIMRTGVCHLIYSISTAKIPLEESTQQILLKTLIEN